MSTKWDERTVYEELLSWANRRPIWQRDALRRLAQYGELTINDLSALRLQIEHAAGLPAENVLESVPLAAEHLNNAVSDAPKTVLASLGPVRHVDRLSSGQPPLRFAVNGVTVIYGPNASGKSGYCRIAKKLCRSVSPAELRGNIYDVEAPHQPEVNVAFRVGGNDQPKEERVWSGNHEPPIELSRISVFDAAAARIYVDEKRRIAFLPYELDIMNKLGHACQSLGNDFAERLRNVNAAVNTPLPGGYHEGTIVQVALANLTPSTVPSKLPSERALRELATWTPEMQKELVVVEKQLNQDPQVMIGLRNQAKQALEIAKGEISKITDNLSETAITGIRKSQKTAEASRFAAETAAKDLFSDQPIPDLGSETWRQMLINAREFAATVFPDAAPPQLTSGGVCVLCQQDLSDVATARMAAFDDYIVGRATEESVAAERLFADHRNKLLEISIKSRHEIDVLLTGYAALSDARGEGTAMISAFVEKAEERLETTKNALREEQYEALDDFDPLPDSPAQFLENEISQLDDEIANLQRVRRDEEHLTKLRAQRDELLDRRQLSEDVDTFVEHRNRLEEWYRLNECSNRCRLNAITRRITERRRDILTPNLNATLRTELERLRLTHIPLNLSDRGQAAESLITIGLDAQQRIGNNSDILSEGEQRALALACFLAELHEIGTEHAIIIDDPVSSLDHDRMHTVAERLSEEASYGRQVIVFTHNILFHHMLWTEARRAHVGCHREWISNAADGRFGLISEALPPWQIKQVSVRINEISQEFSKLVKCGYDHLDQEFRPNVIGIYTKMRETWERAIEEVLFNNVVQRFRPEIMTKRLEQACVDPSTDYPFVYEGMKRCSHYSGHDLAPDLSPNLPEADQVARDIENLNFFCSSAMERRKKLGNSLSYEKGVEPILL